VSGKSRTFRGLLALGTPNEMAAIQGVNIPVAEQLKFYDVLGFRPDHAALRGGLDLGL
jgi:hypothetical protein